MLDIEEIKRWRDQESAYYETMLGSITLDVAQVECLHTITILNQVLSLQSEDSIRKWHASEEHKLSYLVNRVVLDYNQVMCEYTIRILRKVLQLPFKGF